MLPSHYIYGKAAQPAPSPLKFFHFPLFFGTLAGYDAHLAGASASGDGANTALTAGCGGRAARKHQLNKDSG